MFLLLSQKVVIKTGNREAHNSLSYGNVIILSEGFKLPLVKKLQSANLLNFNVKLQEIVFTTFYDIYTTVRFYCRKSIT